MAVMLAGMKLGTLDSSALAFPLLPDASKSQSVVAIVMVLGLAAILYGAIMALVQPDFRRLLAFSSISHLGFVVVGLFALNYQGLQGSLLTMINLGFSTAGFVLHRGLSLLTRQQSTQLSAFGGMAKQVPLCDLSSCSSGWPRSACPARTALSENFSSSWAHSRPNGGMARLRSLGVIFGAAYFLWYYERSMLGPLGQERVSSDQRFANAGDHHRVVLVDHDLVDRPLSRRLSCR